MGGGPEPADRMAAADAERAFLALQAEHTAAIGPDGTGTRLELAARAAALGSAAADDGILAWARMWRLDAVEQLGLRREFNDGLVEFTAVVDRLDSPLWRWRLALVHAGLALLEDRVDDVPGLADAALRAGEAAGAGDAGFLDLVLRSSLAERVGDGLAEVEGAVRRAVAGAPLFAQGWRAEILLGLGRVDEAVGIWRALAPHLAELPRNSHEWLVASAAHAGLAIAAGDRDAARRIRADLEPFAHLHVAGPAVTPYKGPVAFVLGRLAAFLGDRRGAAERFAQASARAAAMNAPWHAARARERCAAFDRGGPLSPLPPLSPRETEVAREVAAGLTNRAIAARLHISERTVEQHVRSILRKLGLSNRSGVAVWTVRHGG
ncbi:MULTISPECIES: helix-turn-helix domain-containing protein [unclassified Nocardiopsis]|uniref:helix-turn-helix domain-containing protein n=1 Tax=Nocardiopsis TaxID=2013 RepID=UPI00387B0032